MESYDGTARAVSLGKKPAWAIASQDFRTPFHADFRMTFARWTSAQTDASELTTAATRPWIGSLWPAQSSRTCSKRAPAARPGTSEPWRPPAARPSGSGPLEASSSEPQRLGPLEAASSEPRRLGPLEASSSGPRRPGPLEAASSEPRRLGPLEAASSEPRRLGSLEASSSEPRRLGPVERARLGGPPLPSSGVR